MSVEKYQIRCNKSILNVASWVFRNELQIMSVENGYSISSYSKSGIVHTLRYYTDRDIEDDIMRELLIELPNGDSVLAYNIYTSNPDTVIKLLTEQILPVFEHKRNFHDSDGFIKLRPRRNRDEYDVEVRLLNIKKDDEFVQGIMMVMASCLRTNIQYMRNYQDYRRFNTKVEYDMNIMSVQDFSKMVEFLTNPVVKDESSITESRVLADIFHAIVGYTDGHPPKYMWYADSAYAHIERRERIKRVGKSSKDSKAKFEYDPFFEEDYYEI